MARILVLDVEKNEIRQADCNDLDDYYRELGSDIFDIARRKINGRMFDIFCDDIGLFRENPIVSAVSSKGEPMLVGNLIFANHDAEGNTTSLSDEDILHILSNIGQAFRCGDDTGYSILMNCNYY